MLNTTQDSDEETQCQKITVNFTQKGDVNYDLISSDDMDEKIISTEDKVSRKEFYSILNILAFFRLILVALV